MTKIKIAYFGHPGSFTHIAALQYASNANHKIGLELPCESISEVVDFVNSGDCIGVIPFENSIAGKVRDYPEGLPEPIEIISKIILPIEHCLLVKDNISDICQIACVVSHPQALKQCKDFLAANKIQTTLTYSNTSTAAKALAQGKIPNNYAVIASENAASIYGLRILSHNIEDNRINQTTFHVIGRQFH